MRGSTPDGRGHGKRKVRLEAPGETPIDTPTVVRWGELDPIKPPSWVEGIEQTFPNLDFRFVPTRDTSSLSKP